MACRKGYLPGTTAARLSQSPPGGEREDHARYGPRPHSDRHPRLLRELDRIGASRSAASGSEAREWSRLRIGRASRRRRLLDRSSVMAEARRAALAILEAVELRGAFADYALRSSALSELERRDR